MKYIMAFDAGTTSARTIIFDKKGNPVSVAQRHNKPKRDDNCLEQKDYGASL